MALHLPFTAPVVEQDTNLLTKVWAKALRVLRSSYGTWTPVPHLAGNFTASGAMTWTVAAGDQATFAYVLMGKLLIVAFTIVTATVAGVVSTTLQITLPGMDASGHALVAARDMSVPVWITDNGTKAIGVARVTAGGTTIRIERVDGSNWTAAANTTGVEGQIAIEVR